MTNQSLPTGYTKTAVETVLEWNDAIRGTVIANDHGYVTIQWDRDSGGDTACYRAHRIECDRRWRVVVIA
jgi:predicted lipoprotein with Yx(FWY)xxD motif